MADQKISELNEILGANLAANDELVVVDTSAVETKRITYAELAAAIDSDTGETNTASNVGTAGVGVFKQKTGADLEFKKINAGSSKVTITDDTGNSEVDIDVAEANLSLANIGGTLAIASQSDLVAGTDISLVGSTLNVDDSFIRNTGDVGTGVYDFGGATSFELPNGASPTVDAEGEIAFDTTDKHLIAYDGTAARVYAKPFRTIDFTLIAPVASDIFKIAKLAAENACTLKRVYYSCDAATNVVFNIEERSAPSVSGTDVFSGDLTATTTEANSTTFSNGAITAGNFLYVAVTSVSGTPAALNLTIEYYDDVE